MKRKPWVRAYLLAVGSTTLSLGVILLSRTFLQHQSRTGILLGACFIVYGILRLRQSKQVPLEP